MPKMASIKKVEEKTRRDKKYFVIKNGKNKRVRFAKPFVSAPLVHAEGTNANGEQHVASIIQVSTKQFKLRFPTKSTWIGWWEALPQEE